jgi:hypothetical protein
MDRELDFAPNHFVISNTKLTTDSKIWILEKLTGRFAIVGDVVFSSLVPAFEDPKEALFYELTWG